MNDDDDDIRSILQAAMGLTSLVRGSRTSPETEALHPHIECTGVSSDTAADAPPHKVPGKKKTKTSTATTKGMKLTTAEPEAATTRPSPPAVHDDPGRDDIPNGNGGNSLVAPSPPSPGGATNRSESPPPANATATTVQRPTPYPHLFPDYPRPPEKPPSDESAASNDNIREDDNHAVLIKNQEINKRSWTTSRGERALESPGREREPANRTPVAATGVGADAAAGESAGASVTLNFPEVLYEIVCDPANYHIVSWLPHGKGFVIHDRQLFAENILPRHFDGAKYTSFTRRLKRWKFERVPRGPEMGAYYNKCFLRDSPELVRGMIYGMEEGEELDKSQGAEKEKKKKSEKKKSKKKKNQSEVAQANSLDCAHDDIVEEAATKARHQAQEQLKRSLEEYGEEQQLHPKRGLDAQIGDEARGGSSKKKKTDEKNRPAAVTSFDAAAYDDAVVEMAMEVHRQKLRLEQQQRSPEDSDNSHIEKDPKSGGKDRAAQRQEQQQACLPSEAFENSSRGKTLPPHRQGSTSPEKHPVLYNPSDYSYTGVSPSRQGSSLSNPTDWDRPADMYIAHHFDGVDGHQQQHESKFFQQQLSSEDSPGRFKKQKKGMLQASQPGHQEDQTNSRQKQKQPQQQHLASSSVFDRWNIPVDLQQKQVMHQQHHPPSSSILDPSNNPEGFRGHSLTSQRNSEALNSEDYLTMLMARRNKLASSTLANNMAMTHQNDKIPGKMTYGGEKESFMQMEARHNSNIPSAAFLNRNSLLSNRLNGMSLPDNEESPCLDEIDQRALPNMSYRTLLTSSSSDPLTSRSYLRSNPVGNVHDLLTTSSYLRSDTGEQQRVNFHSDGMNEPMADQERMLGSTFLEMRNIRCFPSNQDMAERILASSKTHKEIMMMAARDLQARARGEHSLVPLHQQHRPQSLPPPQNHLSMQQQPQMMLPPRHPSMQASSLWSRMSPLASSSNYLPSHAMSLLELEERVERETLAAEAAAATEGMRDEKDYGRVLAAKRRNSRASAA
mmetsp:Transcript_28369/g.60086  ORF Transcript_28369/g.60086 Transcript_28369/m.60086 type:complete len:1011 (+) Transcript_28369:294-3326(+)